MLKILNDLEPFFKDNYERIHIREYARIRKISPPTASTILKSLNKDELIVKETHPKINIIYYHANIQNKKFIELSRMYWAGMLAQSGIIAYLEKQMISPTIILFGSFAKAEINKNSDIDLAVFTPSENKIQLGQFEKKIKRKIQPLIFKKQENIKSKELLKNILNGYIIAGGW